MLTDPELSSVVWHTLAKVAEKQARRELLADGAAYEVSLAITGRVGDQPIDRHKIAGKLTVGHPSETSSSSGPDTSHLVGLLLGRLNKATREKLLRELPEQFAAAGQRLPDVAAEHLEAAKLLLTQLRAKTPTVRRGPVSPNCSIEIGG